MKKKTVNQLITDRIIERIESSGTLPWKQPWAMPEHVPHNLLSKKNYRGINAFLLHSLGYINPCWLTMKQANTIGAKVRKGEKATPVVFWKFMKREKQEDGTDKPYVILRYYNVFNAEQCDGIPSKRLPELPESRETSNLVTAEKLIRNMPQRPVIHHRGSRAFYTPLTDEIQLPKQQQFTGDASYYVTLFHELVHATGHEKRLGRKEITKLTLRGDHDYSKEELVAEMGAAFLCGHCGILPEVEENASAYLQGWLKQIKADPALLIQAGTRAQKAFDHILGEDAPWQDEKPREQEAVPS